MLMIILDGTIVSVALPAVQADLGFTPEGLAWTVNAYLVPLGGLLLLAGRLGDLYGRRRMLVTGLLLFVLASLLCGLAVDAAMLVLARFGQGVAAAMASAVVLGMIVALFPEPAERARAIGGVRVRRGGRRVARDAARRAAHRDRRLAVDLPGQRADRAGRRGAGGAHRAGGPADPPGPGRRAGWAAGHRRADGRGAGHRRRAGPGRPARARGARRSRCWRRSCCASTGPRSRWSRLRVFGSRAVSGGNAAQLLMVAGMLGFQFVGALYLQRALGYPPAATGLAMLPIPVLIAVVSLGLAGRLVARFGARPVLLGGQLLLVLGLLLLTGTPTGSYLRDLLPAFALLGWAPGWRCPGSPR